MHVVAVSQINLLCFERLLLPRNMLAKASRACTYLLVRVKARVLGEAGPARQLHEQRVRVAVHDVRVPRRVLFHHADGVLQGLTRVLRTGYSVLGLSIWGDA